MSKQKTIYAFVLTIRYKDYQPDTTFLGTDFIESNFIPALDDVLTYIHNNPDKFLKDGYEFVDNEVVTWKGISDRFKALKIFKSETNTLFAYLFVTNIRKFNMYLVNTYGDIADWTQWKNEHKNSAKQYVFVFGSNPVGINGNPIKGTGGAALLAQQLFGVKQGEKMNNCFSSSGEAYGLVTVTYPGRKCSLTLKQIEENIKKLFDACLSHKDKYFYVCYKHLEKRSLNGYTGYELLNAFINVANEYNCFPENLFFSKQWKDEIEKKLNKNLELF